MERIKNLSWASHIKDCTGQYVYILIERLDQVEASLVSLREIGMPFAETSNNSKYNSST